VGRDKYSQLICLAKNVPGMIHELGHGHGSARIARSAITKATFVASFLVSISVPSPKNCRMSPKDIVIHQIEKKARQSS
jgi:hypothetical protein